MATLKRQLETLKKDFGAAKLATKLGIGSTETVNRWIRSGLPKSKQESMSIKINKLYEKRRLG